jgi:prevent-host-death family protein
MPIVGLRELSRETREVIDRLERDGEPLVITRHRKPIAALMPITEEQAAALALAVVPAYVERREAASRAITAGEGEPSDALLARIDAEDRAEGITDDEADEDAGTLEVPAALVEQLTGETLREVASVTPLVVDSGVLLASQAYVSAILLSNVVSVRERLRTIAENIVSERKGLSSEDYASELQRAAEMESLAIPQRQD